MRERQVKVAAEMIRLAQREGESYARLTMPVDGLDLETELRYLCGRWIRKDLFPGYANILTASFNETQRVFLFYLLRKMIVEYQRERRRDIAEGNVSVEEREQGLA